MNFEESEINFEGASRNGLQRPLDGEVQLGIRSDPHMH